MTLRRLPRPADAHTRVFARMPSERTCLRCGCVKARHPAAYCTYHGPEGCKRFRGTGTVVLYGFWLVALAVWVAALVQTYRAARA